MPKLGDTYNERPGILYFFGKYGSIRELQLETCPLQDTKDSSSGIGKLVGTALVAGALYHVLSNNNRPQYNQYPYHPGNQYQPGYQVRHNKGYKEELLEEV